MINCGKRYFGLLVAVLVLTVVCFTGCSTASADNVTGMDLPAELTEAYNKALTEPFDRASSEIKDPDLAQFTQKLISSYQLGKTSADSMDSSEAAATLVPDIKGITKVATEMPLIEAGKNIKDKEIAEFYSSFIKSTGVEQ